MIDQKSKYPYALYLDSKIIGAAKQLIAFYDLGVFSETNTIVYLKKYKESYQIFSKLFKAKGIPFRFMKPKELDLLSEQVIFYAFNAQSNCRFVANRKLKHVFITHGESNKVSSIKPIIRIYDHVVMSGKLSLERYYKSGLFDEHDYETGRLIMMGDTFIGRTGFNLKKVGDPVLFYAPTWEGGLESENYSSLQNIDLVLSVIKQSLEQLSLKKIVVQLHPNLGHRKSVYLKKVNKLLLLLMGIDGVEVYLKSNNTELSMLQKIKIKLMGIKTINNLNAFYAKIAFVDISAIETQCINEKIPYYSFYHESSLRNDIPGVYLDRYQKTGIALCKKNIKFSIDSSMLKESPLVMNVFNYSNPKIQLVPLNKRIHLIGEFK